jgi:hypothetical protein
MVSFDDDLLAGLNCLGDSCNFFVFLIYALFICHREFDFLEETVSLFEVDEKFTRKIFSQMLFFFVPFNKIFEIEIFFCLLWRSLLLGCFFGELFLGFFFPDDSFLFLPKQIFELIDEFVVAF